ncbi:signal peptidase I [Bacteroides sp.]|uniref:signal peptidase I n=1 Tax=Bacteroides sp. TaxID=29523 RepID=UPI002613F6B7|nr:signal peptidase I [Bacteroides sp.]MDD3037200.1 signal peptidase I [Bacteroides sp.]
MNRIMKWLNAALNIVFWGVCSCVVLFFLQLFCFASFKIPSDSMEPTLQDGDYILVNKLIDGARLFDVSAALKNKEVPIYRLPGLGDLKRNDVLVFNFPYRKGWDCIQMDIMRFFVKRCIALPGDTLEIRNGLYKIRGCDEVLGNREAQIELADLESPEKWGIVTKAFPNDEHLDWNIREFGPLSIPKKGQCVLMNDTTYLLYKQLIGWEQKKKLYLKNGNVLLGDSVVHQYRFMKNYYFVSGDKMANSKDSRYWGMLPEEYIVGKATRIWYSKNRNTDKTRWDRIMKKIE